MSSLPNSLPPDPFENDPDFLNDPDFVAFHEDEPLNPEPLSEDDRTNVMLELSLLRKAKALLVPHGIKGVILLCDECNEDHMYDWDVLIDNLVYQLEGKTPPLHEPGMDLREEDYASWDYVAGFVDGWSACVHLYHNGQM